MSVAAAVDTKSGSRSPHRTQAPALSRPAVVVLLAFAASLVLSWPHLVAVWTTGRFYDTDDAMRLVQVRAWLDGQGWFDLVAHRLAPPAGVLMHWSRVVDVPLGGLIRLFEMVTDVDRAEILARIVFPLLLQLALIAAAAHLGRVLAGPRAMLPAAILAVASASMVGQFPAGRIDHHAPQITLLVVMTAAVLESLDAERAWKAAAGALALAVSLAISLENLPFAAVVLAVLPFHWVVRPEPGRATLLWFAGGLAVFVPLAFAATIPPSRYLMVAPDAFSIAHLTAAVSGAAELASLAWLTPRLKTAPRRMGALVVVGAAIAALVAILFPACLHGPYAAMDPLLQRLWLSHVSEAEPLLTAAKGSPDTITVLFCPLLVGATALVAAVIVETGIARARWAVLLGLTLVGIAGTLWEVRVSSSAQPLALMGGVWVVTRAATWTDRYRPFWRTASVIALIFPFSALGWAVVTPIPDATAASRADAQCSAPTSFSALAALPQGLVFAPIDDGSFILVHTPHSVVAAPYHRNQGGNKIALEGFLAPPDEAEAIVRSTGARYVALCLGKAEMPLLTREAPHGLAASLSAGTVPSWLQAVPLSGTPYRVFQVR